MRLPRTYKGLEPAHCLLLVGFSVTLICLLLIHVWLVNLMFGPSMEHILFTISFGWLYFILQVGAFQAFFFLFWLSMSVCFSAVSLVYVSPSALHVALCHPCPSPCLLHIAIARMPFPVAFSRI